MSKLNREQSLRPDQLTAQHLLREHGICIDATDGRTEIEVAQYFGLLPVTAAGVEIGTTNETTLY